MSDQGKTLKTPKISVITPTLGQAEFLEDAIQSVLRQQYPNFEHIVYDGGSNDGTLEILRRYPHITWVSEPDGGQSDALNKALRRSTGEIVAWLNSDDWYPPGVFGAIAHALSSKAVVMGACQMTDREGNPIERTPNVPHSWHDILKYWIYDSIPCQPSIFFRRDALEEVQYDNGNYFDPGLHYVMDYDLWLRLARRHPFDQTIDQTLSFYRMHGKNKTSGDWAPIFAEASRVFARHSGSFKEQPLSVFAVNMQSLSAHQLDEMLHSTNDPLLCLVQRGVEVNDELLNHLVNYFREDRIGCVAVNAEISEAYDFEHNERLTSAMKLLNDRRRPICVAMRRVTVTDIGLDRCASILREIPYALPILVLFKGWLVAQTVLLQSGTQEVPARAGTKLTNSDAGFILDIERELKENAFAAIRLQHSFAFSFPKEVVELARELLRKQQ